MDENTCTIYSLLRLRSVRSTVVSDACGGLACLILDALRAKRPPRRSYV
jgi:hypothetical protein